MGKVQIQLPAEWSAAKQARYDLICKTVLGIEGGHSFGAGDRGGETQYGVSLRFLKATGAIDADHDGFGDLDLNMDHVLDGQDIRLITPAIAHDLFQKHFYVAPGFWRLPRPIDAAMFDQAVNGGTTAAIKILQRALNAVFRTALGLEPLKIDGGLGPLTRKRAELAHISREDDSLMVEIRAAAKARYLAIIAADPSQAKWKNGWLARAARLGDV